MSYVGQVSKVMAMTSPLYCINNQHDFKRLVKISVSSYIIKLDFDLDLLLKNSSRASVRKQRQRIKK